jgi:hypothetical protein
MLADLVGEVISSIVGDGLLELFVSRDSTPQPAPPEGEWNASLPSLAAFLAGISAPFCGLSAWLLLRGESEPLVWLLFGVSVTVAMLSAVLAHRALEITTRRRVLARRALWLSRATIVAGFLAALIAIARSAA